MPSKNKKSATALDIAKKPKKRKKNTDGGWTKEKSKRKQRPQTDKENNSRVGNLVNLMGAGCSPAKKIVVSHIGDMTADDFQHDPTLILTPTKTTLTWLAPKATGTPQRVKTPGGTEYKLSTQVRIGNEQNCLYVPPHKAPGERLALPAQPHSDIDNTVVPQVSLAGFVSIEISPASLDAVKKEAQKRKNADQPKRAVSQNEIMGISANKAAEEAGVTLTNAAGEKIGLQWCHFLPHELLGADAQKAENLGIGTQFANAKMTTVESRIRKLAEENGRVFISVKPVFVPGYEKIRLLDTLTLELRKTDDHAEVADISVTFDMRSLDKIPPEVISTVKASVLTGFELPKTKRKISFT